MEEAHMARGCRSQWPYLVLGAVLGALAIYSRRHRDTVLAGGWHGIDDRTPVAQRDYAPTSLTKLKGVDLRYADLRCSNLTSAEFEAATLIGTNLQSTGLALSNLAYADLNNAILYRAVLFGANLHAANLSGADLRGANLNLANLHECRLSDVQMDTETILPNDEHWSVNADLSRFTDALHPLFWQSPAFEPVTPTESVRLSP
jgi:uncharacterized protein YjbI with pentapeptide repeats